MKHQAVIVLVLALAGGCTSTVGSDVSYDKDGTDMIATLSNGDTIRVPCQETSTRTVSRVARDVDVCEIAPEHRQYILEREAEVTAQAE